MDENKVVEEVGSPKRLQEIDRLVLELTKQKKLIALANAEKVLAQQECADLHYKYVVLQLYMKYHLDGTADAIGEDGTILYGGAIQQNKE